MQIRFVFVLFMVILLLAACGGSPEPAVQESDAATSGDIAEVVSESSDDSTAAPVAASSDESTPAEIDESDTGAGASGEAAGDMVAGLPASGIDSETGLAINPDVYGAAEEFIVRGTIISMNLTPTVSPEFLIEAPSGRRYRIRSQDLAETYFSDGTQLRPHEYRQGMLAQATAALPPNAGPTDVLGSENLTLLRDD